MEDEGGQIEWNSSGVGRALTLPSWTRAWGRMPTMRSTEGDGAGVSTGRGAGTTPT